MLKYLLNILIALDQVGTALLGGWPDETMSSYAYRLDFMGRPWGKVTRPIIDFLFDDLKVVWYHYTVWAGSHIFTIVLPNIERSYERHCFNAFLEEEYRRQSPPEER